MRTRRHLYFHVFSRYSQRQCPGPEETHPYLPKPRARVYRATGVPVKISPCKYYQQNINVLIIKRKYCFSSILSCLRFRSRSDLIAAGRESCVNVAAQSTPVLTAFTAARGHPQTGTWKNHRAPDTKSPGQHVNACSDPFHNLPAQ